MGSRRERKHGRRRDAEDHAPVETVTRAVQPLNRLPAYEFAPEEVLAKIHDVSMMILSEVGIAFLDEESQEILKAHGAVVKDDIATFDPELVMKYVSMAPAQFTQLARNPEQNVIIGGDHICFAPVYGPPFVLDRERGRREATLKDFQNFVKLTYMSPYLHHSGGTVVEPTDEPVLTRHLDMLFSHIKYSDKPFMGSVMSGENAEDSVKMAEIVFGAAEIRENPALISLINISSPRQLDDRMLAALKVYAKARQATIITPFLLSGAMAPAAVAGTVAQLNAEALAGIAFAQMVNPGTPVVYGAFQATTDLRSGSPVFGGPESQQALYLSAQLARRYGLPFRSGGGLVSSKIPDAQAGYESVMSMLPAVMGKVNFVLHGAGWLENGLSAGYEKFILDCELLGMYHKFMQGVDFSDHGFALESLRTVPPGGHHLGTEHTMGVFRTAFYTAEAFDYNSAEQWAEEGSKDAYVRATKTYKELLKNYQPPALDADVEQRLRDFMAQRKESLSR